MAPIHVLSNIDTIQNAADAAARAIPPVWPLASSVAVNPYMGQVDEDLACAGARLARVAGAPITMPRSWYMSRIVDGAISDQDVHEAWASAPPGLRPASSRLVKEAAFIVSPRPQALQTIADLAAEVSGVDWPGLIEERLGSWAASYFDEGQALWSGPRGRNAYAAWRGVATHDLTPEIAGLAGFARHISEAPDTALATIVRASERIALDAHAAQTYFHRLLMSWGGWAQMARYQLWQADLASGTDRTVQDLLAVRLLWEEALFLQYEAQIGQAWAGVCAAHATPIAPGPDMVVDAILQEAFERASQRTLAAALAAPKAITDDGRRPLVQAAFCIDVRSEVFRRALESIEQRIQTLGFAGFFGLTAVHRRFASDVEERRFPVLLNPGFRSTASTLSVAVEANARVRSRAARAWGRFKLAAVSSFAFVEAAGPLYVGKLLEDGLALKSRAGGAEPRPKFEPALSPDARATTAETVLRAMSLTSNFAPVVLLLGHGAEVANNPHASALHCGACGGYPGDVNARLFAELLNDHDVRATLAVKGIEVPLDTVFVAGMHNTTTDEVQLFDPDGVAEQEIQRVRAWLRAAGALARTERALKLPRAEEATISRRSVDWAEARPEWGLAGCSTFIAAPRKRTAGRDLAGRAFLHDYEYKQDRDFGVLELILTAPVVVASWISLQYYGSTVSAQVFGAGNKLLHNVTGGVGVVEGNGGILRVGLPWQSVHDGERYIHEPLRLSVCVEAPREAMADVLRRHPGVRALFDNRWLHLFALDDAGQMAWRYVGDLEWAAMKDCKDPISNPTLAA
ncbi:DUF2309 domain-containing protein [Brevundimonas diminuta]|uniref:YbcC family protein n=1 Tax=Brevundimonas diminuta TaxID=293 RepID=UPI0030F8845B